MTGTLMLAFNGKSSTLSIIPPSLFVGVVRNSYLLSSFLKFSSECFDLIIQISNSDPF